MKKGQIMKIETNQLIIRPYRPDDFEFLYKHIFSDRDVMQWLLCARPMSRIETIHFIDKYFPSSFIDCGLGVLKKKKSKEPIGYAGLIKCSYMNKNDFEIGFAIKKEHWGKGYATEIGMAETRYGLKTMKLPRILSLTHPENKVSAHVIRKLGYNHIATIHVDNRGPRDVYAKTLTMIQNNKHTLT